MRFGPLVGLLALIVSLYILWRIQQVLLLAFAAIVLSTVLNRLVQALMRGKINRPSAIFITLGSVFIIVLGFIALVVPPFVDQFMQLVDLVPQGLENLQAWILRLQDRFPEPVMENLRGLESIIQNLRPIVTNLFSNFFTLFYSSIGILLNILLVIFVTIMLLANPEPYRRTFILLFPSFYRRRVNEILNECESTLTGWAIGILFNMTVIAVLSGLGLWILGVRLPLANALLAGGLTFIPNVGPTLSVIPPILLALLDSPWKALGVLVLYIIIQQIESNILTPLVMERQVSLLPAVTLLSLAAFAILFGFLGVLLALPFVVVAQVWLREVLIHDVLNHWEKPEHDKRGDRAHLEEYQPES